MLNIIKHLVGKNVKQKSNLMPEFWIVFKDGAIDGIKKIKGIASDAELARELGITRQYFCQLKKRNAPVTAGIITRVAWLVGSVKGSWWFPYDMQYRGEIDTTKSKYNMAKFKGELPYEKYSLAAAFRSIDDETVETK